MINPAPLKLASPRAAKPPGSIQKKTGRLDDDEEVIFGGTDDEETLVYAETKRLILIDRQMLGEVSN